MHFIQSVSNSYIKLLHSQIFLFVSFFASLVTQNEPMIIRLNEFCIMCIVLLNSHYSTYSCWFLNVSKSLYQLHNQFDFLSIRYMATLKCETFVELIILINSFNLESNPGNFNLLLCQYVQGDCIWYIELSRWFYHTLFTNSLSREHTTKCMMRFDLLLRHHYGFVFAYIQ